MASTGAARAAALAATSLGFGVVQLDVSVVNVAVQPIRADLGGPVSSAQWVVNAYTVAFAALILSAGALGDRIGSRRVFVAGFGVFTAASLACGLAPDLGSLIAFRAVQGVGAALLVPCSLSVLTHAYPAGRERARAVGIWAAGASVGLSGGPLLGGVLIAALDWRWIFFINVPLGLLGIVLTLRFAGETTRSPDRGIDLPGQTLGILALALVAAASIEGGRRGFGDPAVLVGYVLAALALAGFVRVEGRRRQPMLPLVLFRERAFAGASAIGVTINVAFYGLIFVLSLWFQTVHGYSALRTGLAFAPMTGIVLAANLLTGRLVARFGAARVVAVSGLTMAAGLAGLLAAGGHAAYPALVGQLIVLGGSLGVIVPAITAALLGSVDPSRSGVASGALNTARQAGSVVGVAVFGSFCASDVTGGLRAAVAVSIGLALVTSVLGSAFLRRV